MLRGTLHRRRFDWNWHARALHQSLAAARPALAPQGRLICLLAEAEPGFNASLLAAAASAGFRLQGWALRADTADAQLEFAPGPATPAPSHETDIIRVAREAAITLLRARAEPSRWSSLHFAAWCALAAAGLPDWDTGEPLAQVSQALQQVVSDATAFKHLSDGSGGDPASGLWHFVEPTSLAGGPISHPLADRVEAEVLRRLEGGQPVDEHDLMNEVYAAFPGPLTPGRGLVMACLASYGVKGEAGSWQLRGEDAPEARSSELPSILAELRALAGRNGFEIAATNPQEWRDGGQTIYIFAVLSSAFISHYLLGPNRPARGRFLVLPGGRAGMVEHKLRRDPRLRQALIAGNWSIVKFRQVRQMLADESLTRATLEPALAGDPLEALQQLALPE
jgi:hypothetical protein